MAETNLTGPILGVRKGSAHVRQTIRMTLTDVAQKVCTVAASTAVPVDIEASIYVVTVDATETVSVGSNATSYNDLINGASIASVAYLPASNAVGKLRVTANTDIYAVGSAGTDTGVIDVILDLNTVNIAGP